tara:strand:+ start:1529 stop:1873 length:345 start_codon:yes stop_codon:yes gene_type:complete
MSRTGKKPSLQIRKPGQTSARDAFIAGEADVLEGDLESTEPSDTETSKRPNVSVSEGSDTETSSENDTKPARKRTTIYFDDEVYRQLKVHCAMHELEMSQTVSTLVAQWLETQS